MTAPTETAEASALMMPAIARAAFTAVVYRLKRELDALLSCLWEGFNFMLIFRIGFYTEAHNGDDNGNQEGRTQHSWPRTHSLTKIYGKHLESVEG